ncbi:MAG: DUF3341 domain-containing protein, partial [Terriglobia bacterium]
MAGKNTGVFGIYSTYAGVQSGADALKAAGFRATDMAALVPENQGSKDLAHERHSKGPEGFMTGAIIGGIIGGVLGGLFGSGTLFFPAFQPLLNAGTVVAVLAGVGALGVLGCIIGGLAGLSAPEYETRRYQGRVKLGGLLVSVHCDSAQWAKRARQVLKQTGAEDIATATESSADYAESDKPLERTVTGGSPEL